MKKLSFIPLSLMLAIGLFFSSCENDSDSDLEVVDTENFASNAVTDLRGGEKLGQTCFELVYPVTLVFEDGSEATVNSREEARDAVKSYVDNGGERERPDLQFPVSIIQDGVQSEVASEDAFEEIVKNCFRKGFKKKCRDHDDDDDYDYDDDDYGHDGDFDHDDYMDDCFELVLPVSFSNSDTTVTFNAETELFKGRKLIKKLDLEPVFPLTFTDMDGVEYTVNSEQEAEDLFDRCEDDDDGYGDLLEDITECYDLTFPVSFSNADTTATYNSYEELKDGRRTIWKQQLQPDYPFTFTDVNGNETIVNSREDFRALYEACDD